MILETLRNRGVAVSAMKKGREAGNLRYVVDAVSERDVVPLFYRQKP